jgi:hypothetical protein
VGKPFDLTITDDRFSFERKQAGIADEAKLDGIYVIRTAVPAEVLDDAATVGAYKGLSRVERAFRSLKTVDLEIRPIHHRLSDRVRAHVFLCMLAYHVEWHMRGLLAPMLYDDADKQAAADERESVVAKARGLSDVLCLRRYPSLNDEPFAEDDSELGFCLETKLADISSALTQTDDPSVRPTRHGRTYSGHPRGQSREAYGGLVANGYMWMPASSAGMTAKGSTCTF